MRSRRLTAAVTTALFAFVAAPASAEILVDGGLVTEPGGIVRTPLGELWVSDGASGVCRVVDPAGPAPSYDFDETYCADPNHAEVPEDPNAPELPVVAPTAPTGAADMEYDALSNSLYVAEGTSKSSGVWRLGLDASQTAVVSATKIFNSAGDNRVFALTLARVAAPTVADPNATTLEVDFATKRSPVVQRLRGAENGVDMTSVNVGAALSEEPVAIARFRGDLFLAEATQLTRIQTSAGGTVAEPFTSLPVVPGALMASPAEDRLYVGTDTGDGADEIFSVDGATGLVEAFEGGMASVSALGLDTDGSILAADDPRTASGAVDAFFGGRIHRFAPAAFGRPRVEILSAPAPVSPAPAVGQFQATFTFRATSPATLECSLDGAPTWTACDGEWSQPVDPGTHRLAIRAVGGMLGTPLSVERVFVVDDAAPTVSIENPESDRALTRRNLDLSFTSSEGGSTFTCAVDGAEPVPCFSSWPLRNLSLGEHSVVVQAKDMAGHLSEPVTWTFTVSDPPPAPPKQDTSNSGSNSGSGSGAQQPRPADPRRPVAFSADSRNDPCRPGVTATLDMRRPPAVIRVRFASGQRPGYVRIVVSRKAKRAGKAPVKVLTMHRVVESSKPCTNIGWGLWRSEARKLRSGKYTIEVFGGASRTSLQRTFRGSLAVVKKATAAKKRAA